MWLCLVVEWESTKKKKQSKVGAQKLRDAVRQLLPVVTLKAVMCSVNLKMEENCCEEPEYESHCWLILSAFSKILPEDMSSGMNCLVFKQRL